MTPYNDKGRDSGVIAYEIGQEHIDVQFKDGAVYRYTSLTVGPMNLNRMISLARLGDGLNSFINTVLKRSYSERLR